MCIDVSPSNKREREGEKQNVKRYIVAYFFQIIIIVEPYLLLEYVQREKREYLYEDLVLVVYFFLLFLKSTEKVFAFFCLDH